MYFIKSKQKSNKRKFKSFQSFKEANNYYNLHQVNFVVHHDYYHVALHYYLASNFVELVAGYLAAEKYVVQLLLFKLVDIASSNLERIETLYSCVESAA